jgi:branched-chain amino acid transport system permease protein
VTAPPWLSGGLSLGGMMTYPVYNLFASAACIVVAIGLYFVVNRTRLGMMIRAGASNRDMVRGLGINIRLLYRIVFAAGVALAALAGMIAAPAASVYPGMGGQILIICFVVVVIGGIGSISGALIASLLVGFVDTFGKVFFAQYSGVSVYVLMALILIWRPEGLKSKGY